MTVDDQLFKRVRDLAALGQTPGQILSILSIPYAQRDEFLGEFSRPGSRISEAYANGKAMIDYNTNLELTRKAERGDAEAIELLDQRKQNQQYNELVAELFGV